MGTSFCTTEPWSDSARNAWKPIWWPSVLNAKACRAEQVLQPEAQFAPCVGKMLPLRSIGYWLVLSHTTSLPTIRAISRRLVARLVAWWFWFRRTTIQHVRLLGQFRSAGGGEKQFICERFFSPDAAQESTCLGLGVRRPSQHIFSQHSMNRRNRTLAHKQVSRVT